MINCSNQKVSSTLFTSKLQYCVFIESSPFLRSDQKIPNGIIYYCLEKKSCNQNLFPRKWHNLPLTRSLARVLWLCVISKEEIFYKGLFLNNGISYFLSLFVVFGHVQVGIFFLYFPSTPTISRGKQSNPDKDLIINGEEDWRFKRINPSL
jgi:hypothetical protein